MKKLFLYTLFLVLGKAASAQVYKAGTIYTYYYDITPDTLLSYDVPASPLSTESYFIDINGDSSYDLNIKAYGVHSAVYGYGYIALYSLNTNTFKRLKSGTSTGNKIAHPHNFNDSINSKIAIWDTTQQYIALERVPYMSTPGATITADWCTNNDLYVGVKFEDATDTIYGWIRLNCNHPASFKMNCLVKDYSFQSIYTGIKEEHTTKLKFYPNPTSNNLNFESAQSNSKNSTIEIINSLGQTVLKTEFKNQIDVSQLSSGVYTLLLKDNAGGVFTKKFVKE